MQFRFIDENRDRFCAWERCECIGLSRIAFYDWQVRRPSQRAIEEAPHKNRITNSTDKQGGDMAIDRSTIISRKKEMLAVETVR